jgi:isoleucyl-tRNA synthetase
VSQNYKEPEFLKMWQETRLYQQIQKVSKDAELFVLHDGPRFVNGDVHMGTRSTKFSKTSW